MFQLQYQIIAYHDNHLNYYWLTQPNIQWPAKTMRQATLQKKPSLIQIIKDDLYDRLNLHSLNNQQIQFNFPFLSPQHQFIIPTIIYLRQNQAQLIIEQKQQKSATNWLQHGRFFNQDQLPGDLEPSIRESLQTINQFMNDDLQAHALKNVHYLLPETFTAKQVSALLTIITHRAIKRNNIRRDFFNQTKIVGKDRSHAGYPTNLFQYNDQKFQIQDKPKLKGPHKI